MPDRYAQQPAFCLPFNYSEWSRICPLPGFHRTRLFQHADGYSYLLFELYQELKAVETAADLSRVSEARGTGCSFFGHQIGYEVISH